MYQNSPSSNRLIECDCFLHANTVKSILRCDQFIAPLNPLRFSFSPHKVKKNRRLQRETTRCSFEGDNTLVISAIDSLPTKQRAKPDSKKLKDNIEILVPVVDNPEKCTQEQIFPIVQRQRECESSSKSVEMQRGQRKRSQGMFPLHPLQKPQFNQAAEKIVGDKIHFLTPAKNYSKVELPKLVIQVQPCDSNRPHLSEMTQYKNVRHKGYMAYALDAKEYWEANRHNLLKQPCLRGFCNKRIITAKTYCVMDMRNLQNVMELNSDIKIQIASLTKIMTCYLCLQIARKYDIDIKSYSYRVPDRIVTTPGTSAELQAGDLLTIEELLYGLMLPSGNDASICIAEAMGKIIQKHKKKQSKKTTYELFVHEMNMLSKELNLDQQWSNSSGLSANPNYSTAKSIAVLTAIALKNPIFEKIVNTKQMSLQIKNDRYGLNTKKIWRNTNKLLDKGWSGVKTGTTQTAGHCLMSRKDHFLIGVFDCDTLTRRFSQATRLYELAKVKYHPNSH